MNGYTLRSKQAMSLGIFVPLPAVSSRLSLSTSVDICRYLDASIYETPLMARVTVRINDVGGWYGGNCYALLTGASASFG